ncbi:choloylglycine hydrolase [Natrialba hulunbeirensis JCM 10989]|uniref:Choloylglycine hydrolase n=1 Tax=Natrialba hulunbeirensis JCM 10989 TaxID=1227493 RepID=M0A4B8_9EURY|nr:linear amide C-N hydrolase [Natrialba hulunbeirensis]ELY93419.1 choloylglycine hydrolase [Natrialba hulunbeirensis JCM 10989]
MCTRLVYLGEEGRVLTARSMDWGEDIGSNIWTLPRGMERTGQVGPASMEWTAAYGSVVTTAYDIATTDGMNEAGLVANLLWLPESEYPDWDGEEQAMAISLWAQYMLDNFETVADAVEHARQEEFVVVTEQAPGQDRLAALHLSLSDATGDSAIMEYVDGELTIHHSREYQVMTNSPTFDKQLALAEYWNEIGGTVMLPGTNRPADRFVRARFYVDAVPSVEDRRTATASAFGVIRNASVPYGISTPDEPHISSTRWRTVADHKDGIYYFESALMPNTFWVELDELDFSVGSGARTLQLGPNQSNAFAGDVSGQLEPHEPFAFLGPEAATG